MTSLDATSAIDAMRPITLPEIEAVAALQTRTDRKYVVDVEQLGVLIATIAADAQVLEIGSRRRFEYESLYFDTPALDSYLASARRHRSRFKVRTRTYIDTGSCSIEIKLRDNRGHTVKHRQPHAISDRDRLTTAAHEFIGTIATLQPIVHLLRPTMRIGYRRSTLLIAHSRVTIDTGVLCIDADPNQFLQADLGDRVVIETKTTGVPCAVDRLLWSIGTRPLVLSKYGTGLAALRPELPSNKWHRTLARHIRTVAAT